MHRGRSPEEIELAGEECGWSPLDLFKKAGRTALDVTKTPAGAIATSLLVPAPIGIALRAAQVANRKKATRTPSPTQKEPAPLLPEHPTGMAGTFVGADSPMNERQLIALIEREGNPFKKMRMLANFHRSKRR